MAKEPDEGENLKPTGASSPAGKPSRTRRQQGADRSPGTGDDEIQVVVPDGPPVLNERAALSLLRLLMKAQPAG